MTCKLCKSEPADCTNSHIIPKFFGEGIFWGTKPRKGTMISKNQKKTIQDIPKEDDLLCKKCEKGISVFETHSALWLKRHGDPRFYDAYSHSRQEIVDYFEAKKINNKIFNLFVYSIIWRLSVCNHNAFKSVNLNKDDTEVLRRHLSDHIYISLRDLMCNIEVKMDIPHFEHVILRPKEFLRPPQSMLSAASYNNILHQVHLIDYLILFSTGNNIFNDINVINNNRLDRYIRVGLIDKKNWIDFNKRMTLDALKKMK